MEGDGTYLTMSSMMVCTNVAWISAGVEGECQSHAPGHRAPRPFRTEGGTAFAQDGYESKRAAAW